MIGFGERLVVEADALQVRARGRAVGPSVELRGAVLDGRVRSSAVPA